MATSASLCVGSKAKVSLPALFIWLTCSSFFLLEYVVRVSPSVMEPQLMHDFGVDALAMGSFAGLFYLPYIAMQLPVGILVDRYGPRQLLFLMSLLCAFVCVVFAGAHNFWVASITRVLIGFSAAFAFVGTLKMVLIWFPMERFALFASLTQALGMLGAIVGEAPMTLLLEHYTWRQTTLMCAGLFVVLAFFFWKMPRQKPSQVKDSQQDASLPIYEGLKIVLSRKKMWINAAFGGFLYASTAAFAEMWGPNFFKHAYHLSDAQAAHAVSCIFVGWIIGAPVSGWLANKVPSRARLGALCAMVCGIVLAQVLYGGGHYVYWQVCLLMMVYGLFNSALMLAYANAGEISPQSVSGVSLAFSNMASVLIGGCCLQPFIGGLLDRYWSGELDELGQRIYSLEAMHQIFWILPACCAVAFVLAWFIPNHKRWEEHHPPGK